MTLYNMIFSAHLFSHIIYYIADVCRWFWYFTFILLTNECSCANISLFDNFLGLIQDFVNSGSRTCQIIHIYEEYYDCWAFFGSRRRFPLFWVSISEIVLFLSGKLGRDIVLGHLCGEKIRKHDQQIITVNVSLPSNLHHALIRSYSIQ